MSKRPPGLLAIIVYKAFTAALERSYFYCHPIDLEELSRTGAIFRILVPGREARCHC